MKKTIAFLLLLLMLLPFAASCKAERFSLLYSTEVGGVTYCVRGNGDRPRQVVIKQGDKVLWASKVKVSRSVGNLGESYGLEIVDLNFDDLPDLMIPTAVDGECVSYACWLQNSDGKGYTYSKELSALQNVHADPDRLAVFGFAHSYWEETDQESPDRIISTDTTTKYVWKDGDLQPQIRVSITHYPIEKRYCYSVSYYDEETGEFNVPDDSWLTPEEYKTTDFSFLYYFH
jgi:hypothetical protein